MDRCSGTRTEAHSSLRRIGSASPSTSSSSIYSRAQAPGSRRVRTKRMCRFKKWSMKQVLEAALPLTPHGARHSRSQPVRTNLLQRHAQLSWKRNRQHAPQCATDRIHPGWPSMPSAAPLCKCACSARAFETAPEAATSTWSSNCRTPSNHSDPPAFRP